MNRHLLLPLAALCLMAAACAQGTTDSTGQAASEYLSLWMEKYHPGITATDGIYILEDTPGSGDLFDSENDYVYASSTIRSLSGAISSSTEESIAKQLGTYVLGNYYGPKYQMVGEGYSYAGVDALLKGMRIGGTRTAVIPAWLLTTARYGTVQEYLDACSKSTSLIYTVTLKGQTDDIDQHEQDSLSRYVQRVYGDIEPTLYITEEDEEMEGIFYFLSDTAPFEGKAEFPRDTTLHLDYTGRLLNGQIFDTTDEIVAKDAGIYKESKTYDPVSITFAEKYTDIKMGDSSSMVNGFKGGLSLLRWVGQKAIILFTSPQGYGADGNGNVIPAYSPLIFELEIVED